MASSDLCSPQIDFANRRRRFQLRKLEMLQLFRDSIERRLSAINASIKTLESQIERDKEEMIA